MYDDGILVNGPVVMSTTLTFATLGLSILGVLLQVLAGILLLRGGGYLAKEKGRRGLAAASRIVGIASLAFGGYQIALLIPAFRFVANLYTDGKISGYVYRQGETKEVGGKLIATVDGEEYTLTPVDVDNKRYSISYKGETYEGDYDYFMLESQGNPKFYSYKCSKQDGYPHLYSPVISRLGELYLIRAEASAKLGNYTKALADLNTVRTRSLPNAGYKSLDATNAHELIMKERQLELAYEADRGFDVYRVGDTMKRHYPGFHDGVPEYPATSPLAIQYIPQSEINAYPGTLTQNP